MYKPFLNSPAFENINEFLTVYFQTLQKHTPEKAEEIMAEVCKTTPQELRAYLNKIRKNVKGQGARRRAPVRKRRTPNAFRPRKRSS